MRKKKVNKDIVKEISKKILELRDSIEEEYDLMCLVEDNIKEIFECDLDCSTCTVEERGKCMQGFKRANLYLVRKIAQDEWALKNFTDKISKYHDIIMRCLPLITKAMEKETKNELTAILDEREEELGKQEIKGSFYS